MLQNTGYSALKDKESISHTVTHTTSVFFFFFFFFSKTQKDQIHLPNVEIKWNQMLHLTPPDFIKHLPDVLILLIDVIIPEYNENNFCDICTLQDEKNVIQPR